MPLITTWEVLKNSFADRQYPTDKIERVRSIVEANYMRNCVGQDFYNTLLGLAANWETVGEWEPGTYAINTVKYWNGLIVKSTINNNTSEPSLTNTTWPIAAKFTNSNLNTLWNNYLLQIISNKIIHQVAPSDTIRFTGKGMSVNTEDSSNMTIADDKAMMLALKNLTNYLDVLQEEMINYIKTEYDKYLVDSGTGYDYSEVKFIKENCGTCTDFQTKSKRKIMWD